MKTSDFRQLFVMRSLGYLLLVYLLGGRGNKRFSQPHNHYQINGFQLIVIRLIVGRGGESKEKSSLACII